MNQHNNTVSNKQVYYRLIALWVICEAFAGGIMHGINLPFSGLVVSSLAVTCIILLVYYEQSRAAIIKATVIVAIFKLMLSPHSPPTAYIAVFFQGLLGQLLSGNRNYFKAGAIILAILALVESATQRILVLVIVYGNDLWKAINEFIHKLTHEKNLSNYSFIIALSYVLLHAVIGLFVGIYASKLAKRSVSWNADYPSLVFDKKNIEPENIFQRNEKKKRLKWIFIISWLALLSLFIQSYIQPAHSILPNGIIAGMLLRSALIILSWYLVVSPLVMLLIKKILHAQQQKNRSDMNEVMLLVPQTKYIFKQSLKLSETAKGLARLKLFVKILLVNVLADDSIEMPAQ
ncbi:hypothetical protein BH11BAC4_BH11BAC4_14250 [soil metagenome]